MAELTAAFFNGTPAANSIVLLDVDIRNIVDIKILGTRNQGL